jgi:alpha-1,3-rhamnosyl/mannosyltransferase
MLVYPSLYEGFGLPPLEAMASGTPVIVSNASTLPEVVGEAGLIVEPTDVAALTDGVRLLIEDEEWWRRLQVAGLARSGEFSWQRCAAQTAAIYRQAMRDAR